MHGRLAHLRRPALLALGALALLQAGAGPARAQHAPPSPQELGRRADALVTAAAAAWSRRQALDGRLNDPVRGPIASYGSPMIAQAIVEAGVAAGDRSLVLKGLKAQTAQIGHPDDGGFNVGFEVLGLVDAVTTNDRLLGPGDEDWQAARGPLTEFLAERYDRGTTTARATPTGWVACMYDSRCWYNLKLVAATASVAYDASGLERRADAGFRVASPAGDRTGPEANRALLEQSARLTSADAAHTGWTDPSGMLSDPPGLGSNAPLAYNSLASMMLGGALATAGFDGASPPVQEAFERTARSIVGYMAPDGEISYIGRGQGQVWVPAAATYALAIAAAQTGDAAWRARYLAAAERLIAHLETSYRPGAALGLPLAPRLRGRSMVDYRGLDSYASYVMYEGLALYALRRARDVLAGLPPDVPEAGATDGDAVFVDPSHTQFATVRRGARWYAVHAGDASADARYDFGVVAAQRLVGGRWTPALPHRPLTGLLVSGGPAIRRAGRLMVPVGRTICAAPDGTVRVRGGWSVRSGAPPTVDRATTWLFRRVAGGVSMRFTPRRDRSYEFTVWYEKGSQLVRGRRALRVTEPSGRRQVYRLNRPIRSVVSSTRVDHSAYDRPLRSATISVDARGGRSVELITAF